MSGVLRLANTGGSNGRSTIVAAASTDATFTLPPLGGTLLTSNFSAPGDTITLDGADIVITNANVNINAGDLVIDEATGNITVGGNITIGSDLSVTGNSSIDGDLIVTGDITANDVTGASAEFTGDVQMASQNSGPLAGFRNYLINGDFTIWQRGDEDRGAGAYYAADRWRWSVGGSVIVSRNAQRGFRYNQTAFLANTGVNFGQKIEGVHTLSNYDGQEVTFSFYYRVDSQADTTPQNNPALRINIANTYGTAEPGGATPNPFEYIYQGPLVLLDNDGQWHRYSQTITVPETLSKTIGQQGSDFTNFTVSLLNESDTGVGVYALDFRGFQLEPGPVATPFEHRPYGTELALCQRYFQIYTFTTGNEGVSIMRGSVVNGASEIIRFLPVKMRAVPSYARFGTNTGTAPELTARRLDGTTTDTIITVQTVTGFSGYPSVDNENNLIRFRFSPALIDGEPYAVWNDSQEFQVYSATAEL